MCPHHLVWCGGWGGCVSGGIVRGCAADAAASSPPPGGGGVGCIFLDGFARDVAAPPLTQTKGLRIYFNYFFLNFLIFFYFFKFF